jgi:hypothetical protein
MAKVNRHDGWTEEEDARLEALRAEGRSWRAIGDRLDRSEASCSQRMTQIRARRGEMMKSRVPWTDEDVAEVIRLREVEDLMWSEIDRRMQRPRGCSATKYDSLRRQPPKPRPKPPQATYQAHATLTGAILGDPLPGRSALDRKRAGIVDPPVVTATGRPSFERLAAEMAARITLPGAPLR